MLTSCTKDFRRVEYSKYLNFILFICFVIAIIPVVGPVHLSYTIPTVMINLYLNAVWCLEMLVKYDAWMLDAMPLIAPGQLGQFKDKMMAHSLNCDWCSKTWWTNSIVRIITSYACSSIYAYFAYFNASAYFDRPSYYVYDALMCIFTLASISLTMLCAGYVNDACLMEAQKKLSLLDSAEASHLMPRLQYSFSGIYMFGVKITMQSALFVSMMLATFILIIARLHTQRYETGTG